MKKIIAILTILVFLLSISAGFAESDQRMTNTDGYVYKVLEDGSAAIIGYTGEGEDLNIPADLDGHTVSEIWPDAFSGTKNLNHVTIPETVKTIKGSAFFGSGITSVDLPNSLETIGSEAFAYCDKLESIHLPDSITEMGDNPFRSCRNLSTITVSENHSYLETVNGVLFSKPDRRLICCPMNVEEKEYEVPDGIRIIGTSAFEAGRISRVILPESVEEIRYYAFMNSHLSQINIPSKAEKLSGVFSNCTELKIIDVSPDNMCFESIDGVLFDKGAKELIQYPIGRTDPTYTVPEGTETIGGSAFAGSGYLAEIVFPETVRSINQFACSYCTKLAAAVLPDSVENIEGYAFADCKNLTRMNIPAGLKSMGGNPFFECSGLSELVIDENHPYFTLQDHYLIEKGTMTVIWYPLNGEEKELIIPDGVKVIGGGAFENNRMITSAVLPEGLERIESNAFFGCDKLERIVLPPSLQTIDKSAFGTRYSSAFLDITYVVKAGSYAENFCQAYNLRIEYAD